MYEGSLLNGDPDPITRNNLGYLLIDRETDVDRGISLIEEAIEIIGPCTRCNPELFHSYRRDGPGSGRQIGFIAISPR